MPKVFELEWVFDAFADDPSFIAKHMFGGRAAYLRGKIVMCLTEDKTDDSWRGILLPTDRAHHPSLQQQFPMLLPHPVLGKWLYLRWEEDAFEEIAEKIARLIARDDPRFGVHSKAFR